MFLIAPGTSLLRAYMHGFFMDVRLYRKAKSVSAPFEFEEFKKKKIRERIEQERTRGVQLNVSFVEIFFIFLDLSLN